MENNKLKDTLKEVEHDLNILLSDYEQLKVEISISNEDEDELMNISLKIQNKEDLKNNLLRKLNI
jgi:capsular polysaccharide biosynthesis protein|tara:strand:- start:7397 stop:7591 length:195 start_codon:yes stop_codon:yes gene_type:complete